MNELMNVRQPTRRAFLKLFSISVAAVAMGPKLLGFGPAQAEGVRMFNPQMFEGLDRDQIIAKMEDYLEGLRNQRVIYDYRVVMDESNNPPSMRVDGFQNVDVFIKPARSVEMLRIDMRFVPTGEQVYLGQNTYRPTHPRRGDDWSPHIHPRDRDLCFDVQQKLLSLARPYHPNENGFAMTGTKAGWSYEC